MQKGRTIHVFIKKIEGGIRTDKINFEELGISFFDKNSLLNEKYFVPYGSLLFVRYADKVV